MNLILRPIREGFKGVFRHFGMSLSAISAVTVTLIILGVFLLFYDNVNAITSRIEESVQIYVKIDRDAEGQSVQQEEQISKIAGISSIEFISKHSEIENWINQGLEYSQYVGDNNPLLDAFTVTVDEGADIVKIASQIQEFSWTNEVSYGGEDTVVMIDILNGSRLIGFTFVGSLTLLAVFLISNTIKMSIHSRSTEIGIMRIVGATNGFIRTPFIVEGIIIGLFGSIVPILIVVIGYTRLYNVLDGRLVVEMFRLVEPNLVIYNVSLLIVGIAMLVGVIGSFISVGRFLRWKR